MDAGNQSIYLFIHLFIFVMHFSVHGRWKAVIVRDVGLILDRLQVCHKDSPLLYNKIKKN